MADSKSSFRFTHESRLNSEIATCPEGALILVLSPLLFGRLVLGGELSEPGQALGRLTGIALLGFALTSWPDPSAGSVTRAMLAYNLLATIYLGYLGMIGKSVGLLLWPAVALHLLFTALLFAERSAARA